MITWPLWVFLLALALPCIVWAVIGARSRRPPVPRRRQDDRRPRSPLNPWMAVSIAAIGLTTGAASLSLIVYVLAHLRWVAA